MTRKTLYRAIALSSIAVWCATLLLPCYATPLETNGADVPAAFYSYEPGWSLLLEGMLGPLELRFGWYANPLLVWGLWRLLQNRVPNIWAALISLGLAASALVPFHLRWIDEHGVNGNTYPLAGAYAWVIACAAPLLGWLLDYASIGVVPEASASSAPK